MVKVAAQAVGGGGGGRDTMAQAGGREPDKLPDALAAARAEIERALGGEAGPSARLRQRRAAASRCPIRRARSPRRSSRCCAPAPRRVGRAWPRWSASSAPSGWWSACRSRCAAATRPRRARRVSSPSAWRGVVGRAGRALRRALHHGAGAAGRRRGRVGLPRGSRPARRMAERGALRMTGSVTLTSCRSQRLASPIRDAHGASFRYAA